MTSCCFYFRFVRVLLACEHSMCYVFYDYVDFCLDLSQNYGWGMSHFKCLMKFILSVFSSLNLMNALPLKKIHKSQFPQTLKNADYLFAKNQKARFLNLNKLLQNLGNIKRIERIISLHMNPSISSHSKTSSKSVNTLRRPHANCHNLWCQTSFPDSKGFFEGNLTKWIHRHFHVLGHHPCLQK